MKIAVVGAGGIGSYFGGVLQRAGHEVTLFARRSHLEAIRDHGLRVETPEGWFAVAIRATDRIEDLCDAELALITVKSYSIAEAIPVARAVASAGADVVPLLNGVTAADELIAGGVPRERVLGGLARISAVRTRPGFVERRSPFQSVVVGELGGGPSARASRIADALREAGVDAHVSDRIEVELWQKFVFISAVAAVCGLARAPIGRVRTAPHGPRLIERAVDEVVAVARARGIPLPADEARRTSDFIGTLPDDLKPSFLLDLEAGGPTELDTLSGTVVRLAADRGVECPVHETAVAALSAGARGA